jgi:steroid delta-isomerase-like uncharacterized protein
MSVASTARTRAVNTAQSFFVAYNAHEVDKMLAVCNREAELRYLPMGGQGHGPIYEVGKRIWSSLVDAFPDLTVRVQSAFGDERNAAAEVMIGGTQRKQFLDIPSQGKHYELPHAFILAVDDNNLISVITAYWDNLSFYSQLGKIALD